MGVEEADSKVSAVWRFFMLATQHLFFVCSQNVFWLTANCGQSALTKLKSSNGKMIQPLESYVQSERFDTWNIQLHTLHGRP